MKAFWEARNYRECILLSLLGITLENTPEEGCGIIYHGRNDSRLSDTVGMLVKTLFPFNVISAAADCLNAVQLINSMNNDIYPFSQISHEFNIKADADGDLLRATTSPLIISAGNMQEEPVQLKKKI